MNIASIRFLLWKTFIILFEAGDSLLIFMLLCFVHVCAGNATSAESDLGYLDMMGTGTLGRQAEFDRRKKRK